jgi:hypothetical protein
MLTMKIVHNDFHQTHALFELFKGLEVEKLETPFEAVAPTRTMKNNSVSDEKANGARNETLGEEA